MIHFVFGSSCVAKCDGLNSSTITCNPNYYLTPSNIFRQLFGLAPKIILLSQYMYTKKVVFMAEVVKVQKLTICLSRLQRSFVRILAPPEICNIINYISSMKLAVRALSTHLKEAKIL